MEIHPFVLLLTFIVLLPDVVTGHGRLIEPASRNAMWRYKYNNPRNYNDMGLNCGGFTVCLMGLNTLSGQTALSKCLCPIPKMVLFCKERVCSHRDQRLL